ncbi:NUDIX hydrolase domain-like protein [Mycena rebaudengoi]|nr:NUDIX hydrolase domain-like protein [Mycena rebaudengoi]
MSRAAINQLSRPNWNSPFFSKPFTLNTLKTIRGALQESSNPLEPVRAWASVSSEEKKRTAAVLIPFCNVQGQPGILLQIRSRSLRSHSGEVSCPGGKVDAEDSGFADTALRETNEELGIPRDRIELLGSIGPPEKSLRGDLVWPFVGFVHANTDRTGVDDDDPLPSIDLANIRETASKDEVAAIFHLPLKELSNTARIRQYLFRNTRPYGAVEVSDLVSPRNTFTSESIELCQEDEVGAGKEGRLEVWGLTGWYLSLLGSSLSSLQTK